MRFSRNLRSRLGRWHLGRPKASTTVTKRDDKPEHQKGSAMQTLWAHSVMDALELVDEPAAISDGARGGEAAPGEGANCGPESDSCSWIRTLELTRFG